MTQIQSGQHHAKQLIEHMGIERKKHIIEALRRLQEQDKIHLTTNGHIKPLE